ncbi:MAG: YceI family protein [Pseudomonadota bacterium]
MTFRPLILAAALASFAAPAVAADRYAIDLSHTEVMAGWNHLGISFQTLEFLVIAGEAMFDQENVANSSLNVVVKTESVHTGFGKFDDHIKSADFFDVEKHPEATFVSTAARKTGPKTGEVDGTLTIKGVSKPVTLDVEFLFAGAHPLDGVVPTYKDAEYAGFRATASVLRSEFDLGKFAPNVSDEIDITINAELRKQ